MKAPTPGAQPTTVSVKALRSFYYQGKVVSAGAETTLPRIFALEMKAANKVAIVEEPAVQAPAQPKQQEEKSASERPGLGRKER